jgi:hypothetical protein
MSAGAAFMAVQVVGSVLGGFMEGDALDRQAGVHDENARLALLSGEEQAALSYRDERQVSGEAMAAIGQSGVAVGTGSAAELIHQNAISREVEIANIRNRARGEARNHKIAAGDSRRAATAARIGGIFGGASAALGYEMDRQTQSRERAQRQREWESRRPPSRGKGKSASTKQSRRPPSRSKGQYGSTKGGY